MKVQQNLVCKRFNLNNRQYESNSYATSCAEKQNVSFKGNCLTKRACAVTFYFLNNLPIKLSRYDTPEVKQIRKRVLDSLRTGVQTIKINTPEREILRLKIAESFMDVARSSASKDKNFYLIVGVPGSGKSTMCKRLAEENQALHVDIDSIKFKIPEFAGNKDNVLLIDQEAGLIKERLLRSAVDEDYNVVTEKPFHSSFLMKNIAEMKKKGYKIHLKAIDIAPEKAVERAVQRYKKTGRFIDPIVQDFGNKLPKLIFKFSKKFFSKHFDSCELYSSDVPLGEPYRLLDKK